jgi:hypothetical protein
LPDGTSEGRGIAQVVVARAGERARVRQAHAVERVP